MVVGSSDEQHVHAAITSLPLHPLQPGRIGTTGAYGGSRIHLFTGAGGSEGSHAFQILVLPCYGPRGGVHRGYRGPPTQATDNERYEPPDAK